jgi:hypothetical protein
MPRSGSSPRDPGIAGSMPVMDAATLWAAAGAVGTIAAAGIAAWAARQSHDAAVQANAAAASLAAIERGRRHDEVAPVFDLTFTETGGEDASLRVTFTDGGLESLDEVTFTILDEAGKDRWSGRLPPRVTQEEAEAFVWGPWEFNTNASVQIATNRMSQTRAYSRVTGRNWGLLPLRRTRPGHWMTGYTQQQWQEEYEDHPVRLLITCRREGYEPWTLLQEVTTGAGPEEMKQASEIRVQPRTGDGAQVGVLPKGEPKQVHMLVVTNTSSRPIRNLAAEINVPGSPSPGRKLADVTGRIEQAHLGLTATVDTFVPTARSHRQDLLDAGENAAFAWSLDAETYPKAEFTVRFADDQGLNWEVGPDLRPRKHTVRDW